MLYFQITSVERDNITRLFLRGVCMLLFLFHVAGRVSYHHQQRLVVHTVKDILHAPACRARYLPDKSERAMGAFPTAR